MVEESSAVQINEFGNFRTYSYKPKTLDLQIVAMANNAEALWIVSGKILYSKIDNNYPDLRKLLPYRSNHNRRKRALRAYIDLVTAITSFS